MKKRDEINMKSRTNNIKAEKVGWAASIVGALMFLSFIDQIRLNISGQPGSIIVPIFVVFNCIMWVNYGWLLEKKSWQIISCNLVGIIIGSITVVTAVIFK